MTTSAKDKVDIEKDASPTAADSASATAAPSSAPAPVSVSADASASPASSPSKSSKSSNSAKSSASTASPSSSSSSDSSRSRRSGRWSARISVDANTVYEQQRILNLLQHQHRKQINQSKRKPDEEEEQTEEDTQQNVQNDTNESANQTAKKDAESQPDDSTAPAKKKRKKSKKAVDTDEVEITGEKVVNEQPKKNKKQRKTPQKHNDQSDTHASNATPVLGNGTDEQLDATSRLSIDLYSEDAIEVPGSNQEERDTNLHRLVRRLVGGLTNFTAVTNAMKWMADSAKARIQEISVANGEPMQETPPTTGGGGSGGAGSSATTRTSGSDSGSGSAPTVAESSSAMQEDGPQTTA